MCCITPNRIFKTIKNKNWIANKENMGSKETFAMSLFNPQSYAKKFDSVKYVGKSVALRTKQCS